MVSSSKLTKKARIYNGEKTASSASSVRKTGQLFLSIKLQHSLTPSIKINSKWPKDLNTTHDTIQLLKENEDKTFLDINSSNIFLGQFPQAKKKKETRPNWSKDLYSKGNHSPNKNTPMEWEKRFVKKKKMTNMGFIFKINKEFIKQVAKKNKQSNQNRAEDPNRHFSKEDTQMANRKQKDAQLH